MDTDILDLFKQNKILVRAMDEPPLRKYDNFLNYDFSIWAAEINEAQNNKLKHASSTLLVAEESIPTYKNMGFIINSDKTEVIHVADSDSGSSTDMEGNLQANETDLHSLAELAQRTKEQKLKDMNEVNINFKADAIMGLFVNKCLSERPKALILLAQEYYKLHTGKELPIFIYDTDHGKLDAWKLSDEEKYKFLQDMRQDRTLLASKIGYYLTPETNEYKYIDVLEPQKKEQENDSRSEDIKILRGLSSSPQKSSLHSNKIHSNQIYKKIHENTK